MVVVLVLVTGCGKVPKLENGQDAVVTLEGNDISIDNLYNEVKEKPYKRSTKESMIAFFDYLKKRRLNVQLRKEQGADIDAACGQLRSKHLK